MSMLSPEEFEAQSAAERAAVAESKRRRGDLAGKVSYLPEIHRLLPQAPDAEKGILCSWMLAPDYVGGMLREKGFGNGWMHLPAHALIAESLEGMASQGRPIDFATLTQWMSDRGVLDHAGGAAFITELFTFLPTCANAAYYCEIAEEKWTLRELIKICTEYAGRAYDEQDDVKGLLAACEERICALAAERGKLARKSQRAIVSDIVAMIEADDDEAVWGLKTGFPNLDLIARGMRPGNVIGVAGEKKSGKTSLVQNIISNVCVMPAQDRVKTLFFSLENTQQEVNEELLQLGTAFNLDDMRAAVKYPEHGKSGEVLSKVTRIASKLADAPLEVRDQSEGLNIAQMRSIMRQTRPRLVVLDYAQLCPGSRRHYERDDLRIAEVSRQFKLACGEIGATGFLISQLSETGQAAGSRSIVADVNQWWIVEDGQVDEYGRVKSKLIKICAGRRVEPAETEMRWIGPLKKMLPGAI